MSYTVTLRAEVSGVSLPNGIRYDGGSVVVLSDAQLSVISPATQSALFSSVTFNGRSGGAVTSVFGRAGDVTALPGDYTAAQVTGSAPLSSPSLTGTPSAPTASPLSASTRLATTAYADGAVATEKARAQAAEALLAPLASPVLTGTPVAPTATALANDDQVATTAYADVATAAEKARAQAAEALLAPLASPVLTGNPAAPTQAPLTSSARLATTAYADLAVAVERARALAAEALVVPRVATLAISGGTVAVDASLGTSFSLAVTGACTIGNPASPVDGQVIRFRLTSGGVNVVTWGSAYDFGVAGVPSLSVTAGKVDVIAFEYVAAISKWVATLAGTGF